MHIAMMLFRNFTDRSQIIERTTSGRTKRAQNEEWSQIELFVLNDAEDQERERWLGLNQGLVQSVSSKLPFLKMLDSH